MSAEPGAAYALEFGRSTQDELRSQYAAYCKRQAWGLLRLLPREAVRPLYRKALAKGFGDRYGADPLTALVAFCERLLPLPPFETWCEDVRVHATAHLADVDDSPLAPTAEAPATVAERAFVFEGRSWVARLRSFRDGETWRGYIAFEDTESRRVHRTAVVFSESGPVDVRERFLSFDLPAVRAFLRSALP